MVAESGGCLVMPWPPFQQVWAMTTITEGDCGEGGRGHGGPSKPFGNLLWERAQIVMEKVLEKKGVNKWRCFLH
jgi:hypothetical protein